MRFEGRENYKRFCRSQVEQERGLERLKIVIVVPKKVQVLPFVSCRLTQLGHLHGL